MIKLVDQNQMFLKFEPLDRWVGAIIECFNAIPFAKWLTLNCFTSWNVMLLAFLSQEIQYECHKWYGQKLSNSMGGEQMNHVELVRWLCCVYYYNVQMALKLLYDKHTQSHSSPRVSRDQSNAFPVNGSIWRRNIYWGSFLNSQVIIIIWI